MEKKYELTDNKKGGLTQIRALRDFMDVKAGDLGGWIESENNLSHEGDCWVYDNAQVCDNARIFENARISDNVWVRGNVWVCGNARISDNVRAFGNAHVFGNTQVCGDGSVY